MKRISRKMIVVRTGIALGVMALTSIFLLSFSIYTSLDDIWKQLGISQQKGTDNIKKSFLSGFIYYYGAATVRASIGNDRATAAGNLLNYVKQYVTSDAFKKEYETQRQVAKPVAQEKKAPRSADQIRKQMIDDAQKALDDLQTRMKTMKPDMQKLMEPTVKSFEEQIKNYKDPRNEMFEQIADVEQKLVVQNEQNDLDQLKKWEQEYPADVNALIKMRLQKYLSICNTVDFNAELKERNGKKVFVKDEYERKSADWKMIYRAGADVNGVAKSFAQEWLKELK